MAHEFKCDRCKKFESHPGGNKWLHKHTLNVSLNVPPDIDDDDSQGHRCYELCKECTSKLIQFFSKND